MNEKLLVITGPTAVGKSAVSLDLARRLKGEIISADSMQVYRGLDTGTAKPSLNQREKIKHYLIDVAGIFDNFSVAEFQKLAREAIADIHRKEKLPLLVGGSGLYIKAVVDEFSFPQGEHKSKIRQKLEEQARRKGKDALYQELKQIDPLAARNIHPNNLRRIIRAIEVWECTGKPFSQFQKDWQNKESPYDLQMIGLTLPRQELYLKIDQRIEKYLKKGLLKEVEKLAFNGYRNSTVASQALGYKELLDYLEGRASYEEAVERIKRRTRNFAKRQWTWFRQEPRVKWIDVAGKTKSKICKEIISFLEEKQFIE